MQTRNKLLLLIAATLVLFLSFLFSMHLSAIRRGALVFSEWELSNRRLMDELLYLKGKSLENLTADYSFWDDFVTYFKTPNEKWAHEILDTAPDTYKIDALWVYTMGGRCIYNVHAEDVLGAGQISLVGTNSSAGCPIGTNLLCHFFTWTKGGLLEVYGATVHPSADKEKKTPPQGCFLAGMLWNSRVIEELQGMTRSRISILRMDGQELREASDAVTGVSVYEKTLTGLDGCPLARMRIRSEFPAIRDLHKSTRDDLRDTAIFGLVLLVLLGTGLTWWVSRPLYRISTALRAEDASGIFDLQSDRSEFGQLADLILTFFRQKRELQASMEQISNLLNHTGQGILSFPASLKVDANCSQECRRIFGREIKAASFPEIMCSSDQVEQSTLRRALEHVFIEKHSGKREAYLDLMPRESVFGKTCVSIDYKIIRDAGLDKVMVILTDVTEKRRLEEERDRERDHLRMVVQVVAHSRDFFGLIRDYRQFCRERFEGLLTSDISQLDKLRELMRVIHTFKGNFALFGMHALVNHLDEVETDLEKRITQTDTGTAKMREFDLTGGKLFDWLSESMESLRSSLGREYLEQEDSLRIPKSALLLLEERISSRLPASERDELLAVVRRLRYRPFRRLLELYPEYVVSLAGKLGKMIKPFVIEGGDMPVDMDIYTGLCKSLVHVFRNIIDHGIELPDERIEKGKNEYGRVSCGIEAVGGNLIRIRIADDGRGIDLNALERIAREKGLLPSGSKLTSAELVDLIFNDGLSTSRQRTEISGRGVGLASFKHEIARLGGTVEVTTQPGTGTEFIIDIPLKEM